MAVVQETEVSAKGLVGAVQQLVRSEARFLEASDTVRAAEGLTAQQPQELLHRLVAHFQHLFDCPTFGGTITRMNQVWPFLVFRVLGQNYTLNPFP